MDNIETPSGAAPALDETLNTGTNGTGTEGQPTPSGEVDIDKTDNLTQLREHAKQLKKDVTTYKPIYEKVNSLYGDDRSLELAHSVFSSFAGEEFDADKFHKTLEQLSPARSKQLFEKFATAQASELAQKEVEKILGGKATADEVNLFKQWKENGYGLGDGDDLPEALKFDKDGNPESDEKIAFLRNLHNQIKQSRVEKKSEADIAAQQAEIARQEKVQENINIYSNDRLKILEPELTPLGLEELPTDTAEQRAEKQFITKFVRDGVSAAFMQSEHATDYASAIAHIKEGEFLLARPYEARIEKGLIDIMRSKPLGRLLAALKTSDPDPDVRPELSATGASQTTDEPTGRVTGDDIYKKLVAEGKIKV